MAPKAFVGLAGCNDEFVGRWRRGGYGAHTGGHLSHGRQCDGRPLEAREAEALSVSHAKGLEILIINPGGHQQAAPGHSD